MSMSFIKNIFATASVIALASASLVSAPVLAAPTNLTFTNKPADANNYTVCVYKATSPQSGAVNATSFSISSPTINGEAYNVYINNSNNCFPLVAATTPNAFPIVDGHTTEVRLAAYVGVDKPTITSQIIFNEMPKISMVSGSKGTQTGEVSNFAVCQGSQSPIKVTFSDVNENFLNNVAFSSTDAALIQSFTTDASVRGKITYTVFPTTAAVANTSGFSLNFGTYETQPTIAAAASTLIGASFNEPFSVVGTPVSKKVTFSVVSDCTSTDVASSSAKSSSSMSSSSAMSSSSMMASSSSMMASSMTASSKAMTDTASTTTTVSGKGMTDRTGGSSN